MAGRSIALEVLLLQTDPEGLSRASRFSCVGSISALTAAFWLVQGPPRVLGGENRLWRFGRLLPEEKPVTFL